MNAVQSRRRNPILWLVIAIPLATLAGGYLTLRAAYQTGESDEVPDKVVRTGQAQVVELAPDRAAALTGLRFSIAFDAASGRIQATQDGGRPVNAQRIDLQFVHPLHAEEDRTVQLIATESGWQAPLPQFADSDWQLVLKDVGVHWRLVGRLPRRAMRVTMQPSLPP